MMYIKDLCNIFLSLLKNFYWEQGWFNSRLSSHGHQTSNNWFPASVL